MEVVPTVALKDTALKFSVLLLTYIVLSLELPLVAVVVGTLLQSVRAKEQGRRSCRWCGSAVISTNEAVFCNDRCQESFYLARAQALSVSHRHHNPTAI